MFNGPGLNDWARPRELRRQRPDSPPVRTTGHFPPPARLLPGRRRPDLSISLQSTLRLPPPSLPPFLPELYDPLIILTTTNSYSELRTYTL